MSWTPEIHVWKLRIKASMLWTLLYTKAREFKKTAYFITSFHTSYFKNFQYLHRKRTHSHSVFKGFMKGECIRHTCKRNTCESYILATILTNFKTRKLIKERLLWYGNRPHFSWNGKKKTNRQKYLVKTVLKCKQRQPNIMITKYNTHL